MNAVLDEDIGMVYGTCCTPGFEEVCAGVPMCMCTPLLDLLFTHTHNFQIAQSQFHDSFRIEDEDVTWRRVGPKQHEKSTRASGASSFDLARNLTRHSCTTTTTGVSAGGTNALITQTESQTHSSPFQIEKPLQASSQTPSYTPSYTPSLSPSINSQATPMQAPASSSQTPSPIVLAAQPVEASTQYPLQNTPTSSEAPFHIPDFVPQGQLKIEEHLRMLTRCAYRHVEAWRSQMWADLLLRVPYDTDDAVLMREMKSLDARALERRANMGLENIEQVVDALTSKRKALEEAKTLVDELTKTLAIAEAEAHATVKLMETNLASLRKRSSSPHPQEPVAKRNKE